MQSWCLQVMGSSLPVYFYPRTIFSHVFFFLTLIWCPMVLKGFCFLLTMSVEEVTVPPKSQPKKSQRGCLQWVSISLLHLSGFPSASRCSLNRPLPLFVPLWWLILSSWQDLFQSQPRRLSSMHVCEGVHWGTITHPKWSIEPSYGLEPETESRGESKLRTSTHCALLPGSSSVVSRRLLLLSPRWNVPMNLESKWAFLTSGLFSWVFCQGDNKNKSSTSSNIQMETVRVHWISFWLEHRIFT